MRLLLQVTALLALWSSSALFAANLKIPMAFEYIAVDGKKISSSQIMHKSDLELGNGHHEIAIRYRDMVETDISDTESEVKSTAFIISLDVDGDHNYSLKPVGGDRIRDPEQFAQSPEVTIVREDNGTVDFKVTFTDIPKKSFLNSLNGNDKSMQLLPTAASATSVTAAQKTGGSITQPISSTAEPTASSTPLVRVEAEQMLHYVQTSLGIKH